MKTPETFNRVVFAEIDVQNDFCPGGTLATANGDAIIPNLNLAAEWTRDQKGVVAFTRDWHPEQTNHFSETPDYNKTWPVHCVANMFGAQLRAGLDIQETDLVMNKGTAVDEDAYSGFFARAHDGTNIETLVYPTWHEKVALVIGGIATEVCVEATAMAGIELEHRLRPPERRLGVFVLADAVSAVVDENGQAALERMANAGITVITTEDLINGRAIQVRN